jgi:hypothetical protein
MAHTTTSTETSVPKPYGSIYIITCLAKNTPSYGKSYVGITTRTMRTRWCGHCRDARQGSPGELYADIRRYGREAFSIHELDCSDDADSLSAAEKFWINQRHCRAPEGYNRTAGGGRKCLSREPLTEQEILERCDAFYAEYGEYPTTTDKRPVPGYPNETWGAIDGALRNGHRELVGGSSLAELLKRVHNVSDRRCRPLLTEARILESIRDFIRQYGKHPTDETSLPVPGMPDETWKRLEQALKVGTRGLPGASSLARLDKRDEMYALPKSRVLGYLDAFHVMYGEYPVERDRRPVPGATHGETWISINSTMRKGRRGWPRGYSLSQLLSECRGVPDRRGGNRRCTGYLAKAA